MGTAQKVGHIGTQGFTAKDAEGAEDLVEAHGFSRATRVMKKSGL